MQCADADVPDTSTYTVALDQDQVTLNIEARQGVAWRLKTVYVRAKTTEWGINASGDTYGVTNERGTPDLIAVHATNGQIGYVYRDELDHATGGDVDSPSEAQEWMTSGRFQEQDPLQVYESDGNTVVGEFVVAPTSGSDGSNE